MWICDGKDVKIIHRKNTLLMLNLLTHEAIYWVNDSDLIPHFECGAPLIPILHLWMSYMGSQLLHAAAVGLPNKGVLIVGKGGSGKSNTALSCLNSKLYYAADDYCILSFNPEPVAQVFKTISEAHVGDLSFFRIYSGNVATGQDLYNSSQVSTERMEKLYRLNGKNGTSVLHINVEEIGQVVKLKNTHPSDNLVTYNYNVLFNIT